MSDIRSYFNKNKPKAEEPKKEPERQPMVTSEKPKTTSRRGSKGRKAVEDDDDDFVPTAMKDISSSQVSIGSQSHEKKRKFSQLTHDTEKEEEKMPKKRLRKSINRDVDSEAPHASVKASGSANGQSAEKEAKKGGSRASGSKNGGKNEEIKPSKEEVLKKAEAAHARKSSPKEVSKEAQPKTEKGIMPNAYFEKFSNKVITTQKKPTNSKDEQPKKRKDSDELMVANSKKANNQKEDSGEDTEPLISEENTKKKTSRKTSTESDQHKKVSNNSSRKSTPEKRGRSIPQSKVQKTPEKKQRTPEKRKSQTPEKKKRSRTPEKKKKKVADKKTKKADVDASSIQGPMSGIAVVITGVTQRIKREDLEEYLKTLGAKITGSVSGRTTYLVAGDILEDGRPVTASKKYIKAVEVKTKIIDENQMEQIIAEKMKRPNFTYDKRYDIQAEIDEEKKPQATQSKPQVIQRAPAEKKEYTELWSEKYRPKTLSDLVGNESSVNELKNWLRDWDDVIIKGNKKPVKANFKGGFSWKDAPNPNAPAALVSGDPGIGKSSAAKLIAENLGFEVFETNASDNRGKKIIEATVRELSRSQNIEGFFAPPSNKPASPQKKTVIIMDEVDGVSGSDRGGIAALIQTIKQSKVPIICICNDRQNQKIRNLANSCFDIKFIKPNKFSIMKRLKEICANEGMTFEQNAFDQLIESSGNDIRQLINQLQMWATTSKTLQYTDVKSRLTNMVKDDTIMLNAFEASSRLLKSGEFSKLSFKKKLDYFFIDFDFNPLLIQENYLNSMAGAPKNVATTLRMAEAADFISLGDQINKQIRTKGDWSLLSNMGIVSTIAPAFYSKGFIAAARFPEWMGRNSTARKSNRQLKELKEAMGHKVMIPKFSLLNEYIPVLYKILLNKLNSQVQGDNEDGVKDTVDILSYHNLTPLHFKEHFKDLILTKNNQDPYEKLPTQTKTQFTKMFNTIHKSSVVQTKKKKTTGGGDFGVEDGSVDASAEALGKTDAPNVIGSEDENADDSGDDGFVIKGKSLKKGKKGAATTTTKKNPAAAPKKRAPKKGKTNVVKSDESEIEYEDSEEEKKPKKKATNTKKGKKQHYD